MEYTTKYDFAKYEGTTTLIDEPSNFSLSFNFLPKRKSNAIKSIYSFCSYIDDIVDELENTDENINIKKNRLSFWKQTLHLIYSQPLNKINHISKFAEVVRNFNIPQEYLSCLITTCERDLNKNRYATYSELTDYIYGVAVVVGLMCINIFGNNNEYTRNYALNIATALQLTNIIRDIKPDKDRNFIYLPQEELNNYNYNVADLINEKYNDNFINLMKFQTQRAKDYFKKAEESLVPPNDRVNMLPARIMGAIYYDILKKIEKNKYKVFDKKIRISNFRKIIITLKVLIKNLFNR